MLDFLAMEKQRQANPWSSVIGQLSLLEGYRPVRDPVSNTKQRAPGSKHARLSWPPHVHAYISTCAPARTHSCSPSHRQPLPQKQKQTLQEEMILRNDPFKFLGNKKEEEYLCSRNFSLIMALSFHRGLRVRCYHHLKENKRFPSRRSQGEGFG